METEIRDTALVDLRCRESRPSKFYKRPAARPAGRECMPDPYFVRMFGRLRSSVLAPIPLILRKSSALLKAPFFSR